MNTLKIIRALIVGGYEDSLQTFKYGCNNIYKGPLQMVARYLY